MKKADKEINIGETTYFCYEPEDCHTPSNTRIDDKEDILIDNNDYVLARVHYRGEDEKSLAIRWYVSDREKKMGKKQNCIGYPNVRGYPTWFILPDSFLDDVQKYLRVGKKD